MNLLNAKRKNPWQAPPLTHSETIYTRQEKIIEGLNTNQVRLTFKTHESLQRVGADYVKIHVVLNEQVKLEHRFDVGQDQTHVWTIDEQLFKTMFKKDLNIAINKTTLCCFIS